MFALVHDNKIKVGPRTWSYSMFRTFLDDNSLDVSALSREQPNGVLEGKEWRILPVSYISEPSYDPTFQQLAGPFLTIFENEIIGEYTIASREVSAVKNVMKEKVTENRWKYEIADITLDLGGTECTLFTSREDRTTYLDALMLIPDDVTTFNFKFKNDTFKAVNKAMLQLIVFTVTTRIQNAFDWEAEKHTEIEACTTLEELQAIETRHPTQIV